MLILEVSYCVVEMAYKGVLYDPESGSIEQSWSGFEHQQALLETALNVYPRAKVVYK